jgi:hypothetical protein
LLCAARDRLDSERRRERGSQASDKSATVHLFNDLIRPQQQGGRDREAERLDASYRMPLPYFSRQLFEEHLRFPEISRLKTFNEPAVTLGEYSARLFASALLSP